MLFFTSDIHFNDEATMKVDCRPFASTKHFDKYILKLWNKQAKKGDTIYVIGDFVDCDGAGCDGWKKSIQYIKKSKSRCCVSFGEQ